MKKLRKFLIASVMTLSVIAMSGLVAPVSPVKAAAVGGDLIKMEGLSSVYYLGNDGKRYVFPNESTYFSWYSDFSGVVTIPSSELQSYPLGGNVTMRPGTTLVKITTDPSVYAVEPNGMLRKIQSESQAAALYGSNWNKRIVDLADSFFTNYTIGQALASGEVPVGSLVKNAGDASVYYYDGANYRSIASEAAMHANRFSFDNVMTISNTITAGGSAITGMESDLVNTSQGATGPGQVVTGSGLMVSLNSQTPASMNVPKDVLVEMLKINLTAASDGPVNVSGLTLTSFGLSTGGNIQEVTVYNDGVKVGNSKNTISSTNEARLTFPTPIYVAAGTTKTLTVKAKLVSTEGSYSLGIKKASDVTASSASTSGSFPIQGNSMSAVSATGNISKVNVKSLDNSQDYQAEFGEDNILLASFEIEVRDEDTLLESLALYNGGKNDDSIISNLKLFIDGKDVANGSYANRYAMFSLNNYLIEKGDTVSLEVRGDAGTISDTNPTVNLYFKNDNDLVVTGRTHGFNSIMNNSFDGKVGHDLGILLTLKTGEFTIDMDRTLTPSKDVKPGDDGVVLATIKMTSNGEDATLSKINGLKISVTDAGVTGTSTLENVELKDLSTGGVYSFNQSFGTLDSSGAYDYKLPLDEEISFKKGVTKSFTLTADISDDAKEGATFIVHLSSDIEVEGDSSDAGLTVSSPVTGSTITVKKAKLTVDTTMLNSTSIVGGSEDVIVYQAKVEAGTADAIKLQTVKLVSATTTGLSTNLDSAFTNNNITKLSLWLNGKLLKEVTNGISGGGSSASGNITFNTLDTKNYTIPAGESYDLIVKASFATTLNSGTFNLKADTGNWIARSVDGNNPMTLNTDVTISRELNIAKKGTLSVKLFDTGSKVRDSQVLAGSSNSVDNYLGEIKFTTTDEEVKVEEIKLDAHTSNNASSADVAYVNLLDEDDNVIARKSVNSSNGVSFDSLNLIFDADKTTSLFISIDAKGMNVNNDPASTARHATIAQYTLGTVKARGNVSNEEIVAGDGLTNSKGDSKQAVIVASKLVTVANNMTDTKLTGGDQILGKYKLVFDNGSNRLGNNEDVEAILDSIKFTFSTNGEVKNPYLYIDGHAGDVAATTTITMSSSTKTVVFDRTNTGQGLGKLIDEGKINGQVTLVIAGEVTDYVDKYVQTSIESMSDIAYKVGITGETAINPLLNISKVKGANLSY